MASHVTPFIITGAPQCRLFGGCRWRQGWKLVFVECGRPGVCHSRMACMQRCRTLGESADPNPVIGGGSGGAVQARLCLRSHSSPILRGCCGLFSESLVARPHTRTINSVEFHPMDSTKLYSSAYDGTVRCMDIGKAPSIPNANARPSGHRKCQTECSNTIHWPQASFDFVHGIPSGEDMWLQHLKASSALLG